MSQTTGNVVHVTMPAGLIGLRVTVIDGVRIETNVAGAKISVTYDTGSTTGTVSVTTTTP